MSRSSLGLATGNNLKVATACSAFALFVGNDIAFLADTLGMAEIALRFINPPPRIISAFLLQICAHIADRQRGLVNGNIA